MGQDTSAAPKLCPQQQEHPEWFEDIAFLDLPEAIPDIQRRIVLGSNKVLIEVVKR